MPPRYYSRYGPYSEVAPSELQGGMGAGPALSRLYSSTEYGQADPKRKRQMEEMVAGGFHSGVRPSSIIYGGFNAYGGRDAYAPIPLAWGTWGPMTTGGVSSTGTLEKAGRGLGAVLPRSQRERQEMARMEAQAEATRRELAPETQPTAEATTYTPKPAPSAIFSGSGYGYTRTPLGYTGSELSFTPEGRRIGAGPQPTNLTTPVPTGMLDPNIFKRNLTGFGGYVPMFPFSNY